MDRTQTSNLRNRAVRWNLFCNIGDGALAILASSLVSPAFVVAPFLRRVGASDSTIGFINGGIPLMTFLIPLLAAGYMQALPRKKKYITIGGAVQRMNYFVIAAAAMLLLPVHWKLFLAFYIMSTLLNHAAKQAVDPAWLDLVAKTTPVEKRGMLFAWRNSLGVFPTFFAAGVIAWMLNHPSLPFPSNYAMIFLVSGVCFAISLGFVASVRERGGKTKTARVSIGRIFRDVPRVLRRDREYAMFILGQVVHGIGASMIGAFMALTAQDRFHLDDTATQWWSSVYMAITAGCGVAGNAFFAKVGDRKGHKFNMVIRGPLFISGCTIALLAPDPLTFSFAFVLMTLGNTAVTVSQQPMAMEFCSERNRPRYTAIRSTVMMPLMTAGPLLGGVLRDHSSTELTFVIAIVLAAIAAWMQMKVRDPRGRGAQRRLLALQAIQHGTREAGSTEADGSTSRERPSER